MTDVSIEIGKQWRIESLRKPELMKTLRVRNETELMVSIAKNLSFTTSPISEYPVTIVGRERETGDLLIGTNVEFYGAPLGWTIHAEQFLMARVFHSGTTVDMLALADPPPCGHCRQFLLEFADGKNIRVQNARGLNATVGELTPHSFSPEDLDVEGIGTDRKSHGLRVTGKVNSLTKAALKAANSAYCPYSKSPSGVALELKTGEIIIGSYIENVAFNPSLSPLHSAIVNLLAASHQLCDIKAGILLQRRGSIDQSAMAKTLLKLIVPKAHLKVIEVR